LASQRGKLVAAFGHSDEAETDRVDNEVADERIRYQKRVGRELTPEEIEEIHQSPKMHGWIRFCRANHGHNSARLRAEGWELVECKPGNWRWERKQWRH